jgi:ATP-dependent RNA helicase RhlE
VRTYGKHLPLKSMVMFGGVNINPQIRAARRVDILVATPGRLLDHVGQRTVDLSGVEILVLDEADRMLDMGFIRDIKKVSRCCRSSARTCCSRPPSPTRSALANGLLQQPGWSKWPAQHHHRAGEQSVHLVPDPQEARPADPT